MTKDEVIDVFPMNVAVKSKDGVQFPGGHAVGYVNGYFTYNLAFVGLRTFVLVKDAAGGVLGEYAPHNLEVIKEK
jgi:hypothetical protein